MGVGWKMALRSGTDWSCTGQSERPARGTWSNRFAGPRRGAADVQSLLACSSSPSYPTPSPVRPEMACQHYKHQGSGGQWVTGCPEHRVSWK